MQHPHPPPRKISTVQKNFLYQCQICYEDYNTSLHIPMIICPNYHAICSQCVKSNLFKKEYNASKNPTGRYMCAKCSMIVDPSLIRQHTILKEVCHYLQRIKQRDQQVKKEFYQYVGSMGMNLVAMREDWQEIQVESVAVKRENQRLVRENQKVKEEYERLVRAAGALEELKKVERGVEEARYNLQVESAKLFSVGYQLKCANHQLQVMRAQTIHQSNRFFEYQAQVTQLKTETQRLTFINTQLMQNNEGAINLKEYLQQEINNLKNEKKYLTRENQEKRRRMDEGIRRMQEYWQGVVGGEGEREREEKGRVECEKEEERRCSKDERRMVYETKIEEFKEKTRSQQVVEMKMQSLVGEKEIKEKPQKRANLIDPLSPLFDLQQKSIRNFQLDYNTATLSNPRLNNFAQISFSDPFIMTSDHSFTTKILTLSSNQIIIGLMTGDNKNKKNIYNRKGFYGVDGWGKKWIDGESTECKMGIKQGDVICVRLIKQTRTVVWENMGANDVIVKYQLPNGVGGKGLYPVVMLIEDGDKVEVKEVM